MEVTAPEAGFSERGRGVQVDISAYEEGCMGAGHRAAFRQKIKADRATVERPTQLVICNQQVAGSIPSAGSRQKQLSISQLDQRFRCLIELECCYCLATS